MLKTTVLKTEAEKAYFAGLFDGEGTVGVYSTTNGRANHPSGQRIYWCCRLSIVGIYRPVIAEAQTKWGGALGKQKRQALQNTPGGKTYDPKLCRQGWRWQLTHRHEIHAFLTDVLPYLREKREQAEMALSFCEGNVDGKIVSAALKLAKRFEFDGVEVRPTGGKAGNLNPHSPNYRYPNAVNYSNP